MRDEVLMAWAQAAAAWYAEDKAKAEALRPSELTIRDVEFAADVASLIPLLYLHARYSLGYHVGHPPVIIEIGTADGSTTIPLLKAAAETGGHVHSVDPSECEDAHRLVDQFGYRGHWTHHREVSDRFFEHFTGPADLIFHDGDHRWPVVERDLVNAYLRLLPGGIIWLSDYNGLPVGFDSYDHEYDGPTFVEHSSKIHEQQCAYGVAKAACRALPKMQRATAMVLYVWPNPSLLIRRLPDGEANPMTGGT